MDALKNDLIDVEIIRGEQPDGYKLTGMIRQLKTGLELVDKAIGDIYNQQTHLSSGGAYELSYLPLCGPSVGRLLGSAGWLNPRHLGRVLVKDRQVLFVAGGNYSNTGYPQIEGFRHYNRRIFKLPFPPVVYTGFTGEEVTGFTYSFESIPTRWEIIAPGGGYTDATGSGTGKIVQSQRKDDLADLDTAGDYHVSEDGIITLYSALDPSETPEAFIVQYTFYTIGDSYDGASLNVIPDFSTTGTLCTVSFVSGTTYEISLPDVAHRRGYNGTGLVDATTPGYIASTSTFAGTPEYVTYADQQLDPMGGYNSDLPTKLRAYLDPGDTIPAGYIHLYDEATDQILSGGVFTLGEDEGMIECTGLILTTGSSRYRIVTAGTELAPVVSALRESYRRHDHSGRILAPEGSYSGDRIHHYDLENTIDEGSDTKDGFTVSAAGPHRQPHTQLLHRYGYQFGESISDEINGHNAMLGHLVLSKDDGTVEDLDGGDSSYKIYFGDQSGASIHSEYDDTIYGQQLIYVGGALCPAALRFNGSDNDGYMVPFVYNGELDGTGTETLTMTVPGLLQYQSQQIYQITGIAREHQSSTSHVVGSFSGNFTPGTGSAAIYFTSFQVSADDTLDVSIEYTTGEGNFNDGSPVRLVVWYNPEEDSMWV